MIRTAVEGVVARITLADAAAHNALDQAAMRAMTAVLADWAGDPHLRALVVTGEGRSFCSGAALGELGAASWRDNPLTALCEALERFPAPTLAALNGGVYGGGVDLALACDFRLGVEGMRAFVPAARLGIHYAPEGIARAVDRLGAQTTRRMFLLGETFEAEALLGLGFLDRLVAPEALAEAAEAICGTLTGLAPLAVRGMKRTILELGAGALDRDAAQTRIAACFASADHAEALAARAERRPPVFAGR